MHRFSRITLPTLALVAAVAAAPASAGVFIPTKTADTHDGACTDGDCSLREAIVAANATAGGDVILLHAGTYALSLAGAGEDSAATGDLDIQGDLTILGDGAASTVIDGASGDRVLHILAGSQVEIRDVGILLGAAQGDGGGILNAGELTLVRTRLEGNHASGAGAGIRNSGDTAQLTVIQSLIAGNQAGTVGGGIAAQGEMTLVNVTVAQNTANTFGGGIYAYSGLDAEINNVTLTGNTALQQGGGVYVETSAFTSVHHPVFSNSILAVNVAPTDRDCSGSASSGGYNLLGVGGGCSDFSAAKNDLRGNAGAQLDPKLGVLAANGGPTRTFALLTGSPALNAGNPAAPGSGSGACEAVDQRGVTRTGRCDIGAFEATGTNVCIPGPTSLCLNNDRFQVAATFRTAQGQSGSAQGVEFTPDSGYLTFFAPNNVEVTVKVLNGCGFNNRYWVFLAGMTDVEVTVTVTDKATGAVKTYLNPLNRLFRTVADTDAFPCS